ncbi:ALF repeat-containing protein [Streptomyces sp. FXJ7.023]|uniref:ALF repeat-containing protein n=1 Tax=Streptomyces sp. FXJ7.023 TaxID=579932 RepID=UPI0005656FC6|nr:ALF repeat-containing protein [Streptomyces sp. FXJ7.023]
MKAANTAADAVEEAKAVETAAREAETARITEDTELGVLEARLRAQAEIDDAKQADNQRTLADRTATETKDAIAAAEAALEAGDTATAVTRGREAAVKLLDSTGSWTRGAAEFALAGEDQDVVNWIGADRLLAQRQDDRETVLTIAESAKPAVAEAAHKALADEAEDAATDFLATGVIEAAATDNRVTVFSILNEDPGKAVRAKAEAALSDGGALALHRFLNVELAEAVKQDDQVEIFRLLNSGGPYMKSAAEIVLEGSARMRRYFVARDKYYIARLDEDHATHVAAVRATLAHAAKVAAKALEDAALASKAAAEARQAAEEATEWAAKAKGHAEDAADAADDAKANADAADKSAADAAASAARASQAATVARGAARTANYSMRQASASARQAVASAAQAQASAASARASAIQAGADAKAAADAASEANAIVAAKRKAEAAEAARKAAEKAKQDKENGTNPSQNEDEDKPWYWDWELWPEDIGSAKQWATVTGHWSTIAGGASVILGVGALCFPPAAPALLAAAGAVGLVSWGLQGASALLNGIADNWQGSDFHTALGMFAVGGIFLGKGALISKFGGLDDALRPVAEEVGSKISGVVGDAATTVVGWLTW